MYDDRVDAGRKLAKALERFKGKAAVVLGLPRGGIVPAAIVAKALGMPLGLVLVKKIGHPDYPEYAIGALAEGQSPVYNPVELPGLDSGWLQQAEAAAKQALVQRHELYYGTDFIPPEIKDKLVILVDDGIATGLSMEAAVRAVRHQEAKRVIVAVPVAPRDSVDMLEVLADEVVVLSQPEKFHGAVGSHYRVFNQVDDATVRSLLREVKHDIQ